MTTAPSLLALAGSTRRASLNRRLLAVAVAAARDAGAAVTVVDLRDYPLPLYDGDLEAEQGVPAPARALRDLFLAHSALLLASPEHNASIAAVLKNAIDWISRPDGGVPGGVAFRRKVAALLAASPGALGGLRALPHLRASLEGLGALVIPEQFALGRAHEAWDDAGALKDPRQQAGVAAVARRLVEVAARLA